MCGNVQFGWFGHWRSFPPNQNVCNYLNEQRRSGGEMVIKLKLSAVVEMN